MNKILKYGFLVLKLVLIIFTIYYLVKTIDLNFFKKFIILLSSNFYCNINKINKSFS